MVSKTVQRFRVFAVCMCLTALAFRQNPGFVTPDTKVDLTVNPLALLQRAAQLWDTSANFGQIQNQSYGYLWPMGPFHALGWLLNMPAWVVQRLWWAVLLCVAFTGVVKLAGKLNIGTPGSRLIGGLAFALSVRTLSELGGISVEAWPAAVAPWVLVPLAGLPPGARLRKAVALSALAVACAGGVNATAVFAVVPLTLLWLFSLESTRQRFFAVLAWSGAVLLATAWWILPLLVLGRYAPPFLNFIETAEVTTRVTDVQTILRGASHWQAYFSDLYGPVWPAGKRLTSEPLLIWASVVVAAIGLAGLARRGMPHRRFLITGLLLGLAMVGFGHVTAVGGAFPQLQQEWLDGVAVAFRNVHKFDVVIRLPLALGLCHAVGVFFAAAAQRSTSDRAKLRAGLVGATALVAVAGVASPALAGGLTARGEYVTVPVHWRQAAAWLDQNLHGDRVLVVPGARFGEYRWGSTTDEVIQPLLQGRWAVRNAIPLAPAGTIRFLDAIEQVLSTDAGSPGLADLLARAGIRYVMVRADIDYGKVGASPPAVVRQALLRSTGFTSVAAFGTVDEAADGSFLDRGLAKVPHQLEIFEVERDVKRVTVHDASSVTTLVGGPETLVALAAAGTLPAGPTVLAGELPQGFAAGNATISDGLRRREVNFGLAKDNTSATLDAKQPLKGNAPVPDYLSASAQGWQTVAAYTGIAAVTASESWADVQGLSGNRPAHHPFAAVDGDPATSWRTAPGRPVQTQWLEVRFQGPRSLREVKINFDPWAAWLPTKVTIDTGVEQVVAEGFNGTATVQLGGVTAARFRIFINAAVARGAGSGGIGISEIEMEGLEAGRHLVVPAAPAPATVSQLLFTAATGMPACYFLPTGGVCDPERAREPEEGDTLARSFTLPAAGRFRPSVWARPKPGLALDAALGTGEKLTAIASTAASAEPAASAAAVIDGDPATAWQPIASDQNPWLRVNFGTARTFTGLSLTLAAGVAASRPWGVQVIGDDGIRVGVVDGNGTVELGQPMTTDEVTIFFLGSVPAFNRDPYINWATQLPVAVGELSTLPGDPKPARDPEQVLTLPCGSGPTLAVGDQLRRTALQASRRDLVQLREIPAVFCGEETGDLTLGEGSHLLNATAGTISTPSRVGLTDMAHPAQGGSVQTRVESWHRAERRVNVQGTPTVRVLSVAENINPGWRATLGGKELTPVTVDGWQQGWLLPAGVGGTVVLSYGPEWTFRAALLVGAGAIVVLLVLAILPGNRRPAYVPGRHRFRREGLYLFGGLALVSVGGLAGVLLAVGGVAWYFVTRFLLGRASRSDRVQVKRAARRWLWLVPPGLFVCGAWLADGVSDRHTAIWPQLTGLAAVVLLWLSAYWPSRAGSRPAPVHDWAFYAVPADSRHDHRDGHGREEHRGEVAAEHVTAGHHVYEMHREGMPQEQPEGDRAEPAHGNGVQRVMQPGVLPERHRD